MILINLLGSFTTPRQRRTIWERKRIARFTPEQHAAHIAKHREHDRAEASCVASIGDK